MTAADDAPFFRKQVMPTITPTSAGIPRPSERPRMRPKFVVAKNRKEI
jgi:hypothetical protein